MLRVGALFTVILSCTHPQAGDAPLWTEEEDSDAEQGFLPFSESDSFESEGPQEESFLFKDTDKEKGAHPPQNLYASPEQNTDPSFIWYRMAEKRVVDHAQRWVNTERAHLRAAPSSMGAIVGQLKRGDKVVVESMSADWAKLSSGAYIPAEALSPRPTEDQGDTESEQ